MQPRVSYASIVLLTIAAMSAHAQSPDASIARSLAATCANCHGTAGHAQGAVAPLAGQSKVDIIQKMNDYRDGKRQATIMHQLAKGYTPQQIELMAGWFAEQKAK